MVTRMKENVLVISTVASTIDQFCMQDIEILQEKYNVHIAANFEQGNNTSTTRLELFKEEITAKGIEYHHISMKRNPIDIDNFKAGLHLNKLIKKYNYKIIHCHTPVAAMVTRFIARKYRYDGLKVIYTAHGFHFYTGAPLKNWLLYYPIEFYLSKFTDVLITINKEDYQRVYKKFRSRKVEYIPGIGVNIEKINDILSSCNKNNIRQELEIQAQDFVILSIGELNRNKNHEIVIRAIAKLNNPNIVYLICGQGTMKEELEKLIKELNLQGQVRLLGYRENVIEICNISDLFVFPSYREGLSVALMEAMTTGLPVICSNIRGNMDLIEEDVGGFLVNANDLNGIAQKINYLYNNRQIMEKFSLNNKKKIKNYSRKLISQKLSNVYKINEERT
ncbi:glycosyltransferase family 4 protein [Paenibacillus septentrionalis]|uniref:Glycosyltransferase family 4 protein n=1 Tax=Paenibacillus septentrionalis TaxID=429342 RepID=A0ABW1V745_9BACL